ncbi:hypothetical protein ABXT08_02300 [Chryseobacterium sp. NRRL B-14859]|uniref:hypothetical protein n=1 Tax=unclassified Chryseobacterium TaxID=2593645 RepID=UPI000F454B0E|nr:hypothetical protein [Chryseobacterium sp. G0240]ROI02355.1 hypothetical protein EGI16_15130 [Chryseobacterium sp. G0240]
MRKILSTLFLTSGLLLSAQVGIQTDTPKATLDVNGDINFRNKIVVLNTTDNTLSEGNNDQLLVSQGVGYPPIWKSLRIPEYEPNKFYLIFNNSFSDKVGIKFTNSEEANMSTSRGATFNKGVNISSLPGFKKIDALSQTVSVFSTQSKAYFQFETVVQANFNANGTTDTSIDYACGIFVDDKLVNLRQRNLKASSASYPFLTHNQIGIVENLSKGDHTVSVGCVRLASYGDTTKTLAIGTNTSTNINGFVAQSSLKVDVYEIPEVFNPIIN